MFYTYTEEEAVIWGGGRRKVLENSARRGCSLNTHFTSANSFAHHAAWREHTMGGRLAPHPLHNSGEKPQNSESNLGMTTQAGFSQSWGNFSPVLQTTIRRKTTMQGISTIEKSKTS